MLLGIDISNWQSNINLEWVLPNVDFVICKATEGTGFVDKYCDGFIQSCKDEGNLWGFYHFAGNGDPVAEADYFIRHTRNYFGEGIPVLDWEGAQSVDWVNRFVRRVHEKENVWPWIYANPWRFNQGGVEENCARWIASYPAIERPKINANVGKPPSAKGNVVCWQFASDGWVSGYDGKLDVNQYFGDAKSWHRYAAGYRDDSPSYPPTVEKTESFIVENNEYRVTVEVK